MNNPTLYTTATVWLALLLVWSIGLNQGAKGLASYQFCEKIEAQGTYNASPVPQVFGKPFKFISEDAYPQSCLTSKRASYGNYRFVFPGVVYEAILYILLVAITYIFIERSKARRGIV